MTKFRGKQAVVIGASMGGLLAARVLADYFEQVTLLERDIFPAPGQNRKGVPQGKHTHALLNRGRGIIERLLPGTTAELAELGAITDGDSSQNIRWFNNGGYHRSAPSGITGIGVSRPTLEAVVRKRVVGLSNVEVIEGCDVLGLAHTADNSRITGVRLIRRQAETPEEETLTADLVVDAGGRGSRAPAWLESLGYDRPEKEEIRVNMGYTTCYFRRQSDHMPGINAIVVAPNLPGKVGGVIVAQEDNRWVVTLFGYSGHHAPLDPQEFLEFARNLPTPDIYNIIKDAELLGEAAAYKFPANLRQRYEKLARFPEGYLVIGDALCSFNPIYGQGMTVAATEAEALGESLANGDSQLAKRFFDQASKIIDTPWRSAAGSDLRNPEVEGNRTPMVRFINWYIDRLHIAAQQDAEVSIAFLKVINMLVQPPTVMHPRIAWRILRANLRRKQYEPAVNAPLINQHGRPQPL